MKNNFCDGNLNLIYRFENETPHKQKYKMNTYSMTSDPVFEIVAWNKLLTKLLPEPRKTILFDT